MGRVNIFALLLYMWHDKQTVFCKVFSHWKGSCCNVSVMSSMLLSGASAQVHLALAATRDLRLVSSPDVLTDGFVELSCSTLYFPFLASAMSSFALLEYLIAPPWVQTSPVVTSPALGFSTSMRCSTLRFTSNLDFSLHRFRLQRPRYSMDTSKRRNFLM